MARTRLYKYLRAGFVLAVLGVAAVSLGACGRNGPPELPRADIQLLPATGHRAGRSADWRSRRCSASDARASRFARRSAREAIRKGCTKRL